MSTEVACRGAARTGVGVSSSREDLPFLPNGKTQTHEGLARPGSEGAAPRGVRRSGAPS